MKLYILSTNSLKEEKQYETALSLLSKEHQKQMQSCAESQRYAKCAGRLLLYYACHKQGISDIAIEKNRHGKPYLASVKDFYFNLSHSGTMAALLCAETPVGVDIETIRKELPKHLHKILSLEEQAFLEKQSNKQAVFTTLWSRKESYVKKRGGRIFDHPKQWEMADEKGYRDIVGGDLLHSYHVQEYILSLCVEEKNEIPMYQFVTLCDILQELS